ncbi:hypothetical protein [Pseudoduganella lurida]|nr:hypothetical protein [Pseudoduganella lurida]
MLALLQHLAFRRYDAEPCEAADEAIRAWIAARHAAPVELPPIHGYRWKTLFLPAGTRLRIQSPLQTCHAEVIGDEIICESRAVSPNQFVTACAGAPRNAWSEICLLLPGEKFWKLAGVRRNEILRAGKLAAAAASSAAEAIAASARPPVVPKRPEPARERRVGEERREPRDVVGEDYEDH